MTGPDNTTPNVTRLNQNYITQLEALAARYRLNVQLVGDGDAIPGSFWGDDEAGLIGDTLYVRSDTPLHSALHESCHYICMKKNRRDKLHTNAGGNALEENCVCYLQILMAKEFQPYSQQKIFADMDTWGYSFRLGSAQQWFLHDTAEERITLESWGVVNKSGQPSFLLRQ